MTAQQSSLPPLAQTSFADVFDALEVCGRRHLSIVAVPPSASIKECLHTLATNNVLSVPILARVQTAGRFSSILSVFDLVTFLVEQLHKQGLRTADAALPSPSSVAGKDHVDCVMDWVLAQRVELATTLDDQRESYRVWTRDVQDSLIETIHAFATGHHRALLTSVNDIPSSYPRMFTQSDLVHYVHAHPESVASIANLDLDKPISEHASIFTLKQNTNVNERTSSGQSLISIGTEVTALQAFETIYRDGVLAMPIIDSDGKIVSTVSTSHLRGLTHSTLRSLRLPILDFLKTKTDNGQLLPPVICTLSTTVRQVLDMLVSGALHRVWVVANKDSFAPVGVVTLSDVIRLFDA